MYHFILRPYDKYIAAAIATYIIGEDEEARAIRRTIIRYLVLSQTLVLRNISVQVRRRFPTLDAIEAANFMTLEEQALIEGITDEYTQMWMPTIWAENIVSEAKQNGKIISDPITANISSRIEKFRTQLKNMIIFDWIPIPLVYPQLVTFCVRFYFIICLFTRQISRLKEQNIPESPFLWIPVTTIIEFIIYMGWLKVAEDMLHPLGEKCERNFECNHIIDQNLITGLLIVDKGRIYPKPKKDAFWDTKFITPLYSFETANRHVFPMTGTASHVKYSFYLNIVIL
uniref:Bestrophin homolog n=1 Tax=Panagrolaimus sp. PS1159 TaxID=55785 RepID=A0AC35FX94_9BILA